MKKIFLACVALGFIAGSEAVADDDFQRDAQPFLTKHCIDCHRGDEPEGNISLQEVFKAPLAQQAKTLLKMQEVLAHGEMPPIDEPRPPKDEVASMQAWIETQLTKAAIAERKAGPRMVVRRLNRVEYNNTIRDLFDVNISPANVFPEDDSAHGFDNVGSALTFSPLLLEKYLAAAQYVTERTLFEERPETVTHRFPSDKLWGQSHFRELKAAGRLPAGGEIVFYMMGPRSQNGLNRSSYPVAYPRPHFQSPTPGEYIFRTRAWSIGGNPSPELQRTIFYSPKHLKNYPPGIPDMQVIFKLTKETELVTRFHLSRKPAVHEKKVFLEAGQEFEYRFENGAPNVHYRDVEVLKNYPGPGMVIDWIEVEGPVYDQWPPASHLSVFFEDSETPHDRDYAKRILKRFASRAFRRPATEVEVDGLLSLFEARQQEGESFVKSVAAAIELTLCSPNFLFLAEPVDRPGQTRRLNDYELATRLSYFLWSSMPDAELFRLAEQGELTSDPRVLETQVRRMLKDPKAKSLTTNFAAQWLGLRKLHEVAVDEKIYNDYTDYLEWLLQHETEAFFEEILHHDLSVLNFIDSDFMMLNDRLALHYGIEGVKGPEFRRVPTPADGSRGGLISQAGILALTTCGTRTSPVMRGVWVLDRLLGYETPPPPKDVPPITPDTRGAKTIRDQIALHRADNLCARCHNKIDPLGLALENYDVVGNWRDYYSVGTRRRDLKQGLPVDSAVTMLTGEDITHPKELRAALMKQKDRFCHSLVEKLLTYALGRGVGLADRHAVGELEQGLKDDGYKLSSLIVEIVKSEPFQTR